MNYKGKLYGKIAGKYFDTGVTSEDYDGLIEQNRELVEMLERAKSEFEQFRDAFGQGSLLINDIEKLILKHDKQ